jgi:hypothetical protein
LYQRSSNIANVAELVIKLSGQDATSGVLAKVKGGVSGLGSAFGTALKVGALGAAAVSAAMFAAVDFRRRHEEKLRPAPNRFIRTPSVISRISATGWTRRSRQARS